ncbi:MAG: AAA family ATPase, partial [Chloroflexota bacterium]
MATQSELTGRLIGRQAELETVQRHIGQLLDGDGSAMLLSGEAGIGKSRLIDELIRRFVSAVPEGQVLVGRCFERDRGLAYAPVLDMLRTSLILDERVDRRDLFSGDPAAFLSLLPELAMAFPEYSPLDGTAPEEEKHRIFNALLGFVAKVARNAPLVIVFEDLH